MHEGIGIVVLVVVLDVVVVVVVVVVVGAEDAARTSMAFTDGFST